MLAPNKPRTGNRKATMLRIEQGLYDQIASVAKSESRSVNQQIMYYLRKAIAEAEEKGA